MALGKDSKIYVAGHRGLVGAAVWANLLSRGYCNLVGRSHGELDLEDGAAVRRFFDEERPDAVVLAAAHVGGIMANSRYRADFIMKNLRIQCNVIGESYAHGVSKLLFLGSTCIYPKDAPQPMAEDALLTSPLEYTNEPYAIAKIAGLKMCESYNLQYGTDYVAVMPTNLYGPGDNFHLENSHVLPSVMRKTLLAKWLGCGRWDLVSKDLEARPVDGVDGTFGRDAVEKALSRYGITAGKVELWGTGKPMREFMWSGDMADASVHVLLNVGFKDIACNRKDHSANSGGCVPDTLPREIRNCHINIGTGKETSIAALAGMVAKSVGFDGEVAFDAAKPDGTMRKLTDVSKLHSLGWRHKVELEDGVGMLRDWYMESIGG